MKGKRKSKKKLLKKFSKRIKKLRTQKEITLHELARKSGIKHTKLKKLDKGYYNPCLPELFYLAKGLNIKIAELWSNI